MVCPILEYCSTVWDPHLLKDNNKLEKVQRRAARWITSNYNWSSSVTSMLELLQWHTLTTRIDTYQDYIHSTNLFTTLQQYSYHLTSPESNDLPISRVDASGSIVDHIA